jgi:hypothetical protein
MIHEQAVEGKGNEESKPANAIELQRERLPPSLPTTSNLKYPAIFALSSTYSSVSYWETTTMRYLRSSLLIPKTEKTIRRSFGS